MKSLGTLLVKHDWISKQQLGLAISKQREIGGRLGTCLLEMGAIEEDLLDRSLAEQQGVPVASAKTLRGIPDKVSQVLPAPIAIRYRAIPFNAGHSEVDIAMMEVDNLWLQDELSFIVGRRLNVYIANEVRIAEGLSRYYGAPLSERFAKLFDRVNQVEQERAEASPHPKSRLVHSEAVPTVAAPPAVRPEIVRPAREADSRPVVNHQAAPFSGPKSIPVSDQELQSLQADAPGEETSIFPVRSSALYSRDLQPTAVMDMSRVESSFEAVKSPEDVGLALLDALDHELTRVVLLKVAPAGVSGWLARGPGLDPSRLASYRASFDEPSIFLNLREGGSFYLGHLPEMTPHLELSACWNNDLSDECVVFPIRVRERLVSLIYGDRGPVGLVDLNLEQIRHLAAVAASSFEACIVRQKGKKQQVSSG